MADFNDVFSPVVKLHDASPRRRDTLIRLLKDADPRVRSNAAVLFTGKEPGVSAIDALGGALSDRDDGVRLNAAHSLMKFDKRASRVLASLIVALSDSDPDVRGNAAGAIAKVGADAVSALPNLINALDDSSERVQFSVMIALLALGPAARAAIPKLRRLVKVGSPEISRNAEATLAEVGAGDQLTLGITEETAGTDSGRPIDAEPTADSPPGPPPLTDFSELAGLAMEELRFKTEAHAAAWRLGQEEEWNLDQDDGRLKFSFPDGLVATCPAQIIGTFNSGDGTWLWAWANSSIAEPLTRDARRVKAYGEQHGITRLTESKWRGTEEDAWAMTALAAKLCGAQGAYRGPAGATYVFMTFGQVQLKER
jgi:hypothetical protein